MLFCLVIRLGMCDMQYSFFRTTGQVAGRLGWLWENPWIGCGVIRRFGVLRVASHIL